MIKNFNGVKFGRKYAASVQIRDTIVKRSTCRMCEGQVHRSWLTGILHKHCRACRQLIMTYGPGISVRRVEE